MTKSSFETLGLLPSLVEKLSERQLLEVVKAAVRGLQHTYHPDRNGGDPEMSMRINEAAGIIGNPLLFRMEKDRFAASGPGQQHRRMLDKELLSLYGRIAVLNGTIDEKAHDLSETGFGYNNDVHSALAWVSRFYLPGGVFLSEDYVGIRQATGASFNFYLTKEAKRLKALKEKLLKLESMDKSERKTESEEAKRIENSIPLLEFAIAGLERELYQIDPRWPANLKKLIENREFQNKQGELGNLIARKESKLKRLDFLKGNAEVRTSKITQIRKEVANGVPVRHGLIDEKGYVHVDGFPTGMRVAGVGTVHGGLRSLRPWLLREHPIFCVDGEKKTHEIGILLSFEPKQKFAGQQKAISPAFEAPDPENPVCALVPHPNKEGTQINPLEHLGVLPSALEGMNRLGTRRYLQELSKTLKRVMHPDFESTNIRDFVDVCEASAVLDSEATLAKAVRDYRKSMPQGGAITELHLSIQKIKARIASLTPRLASIYAELKERNVEKSVRMSRAEIFMRLLFDGLYTDRAEPPAYAGGRYVHGMDGGEVALRGPNGMCTCRVEVRGFDAFAVSEGGEKLIVGCLSSEMRQIDKVLKDFENPTAESVFMNIFPVIYEGAPLVCVENGGLMVLGTVDKLRDVQARTAVPKNEDSEKAEELSRRLRRIKGGRKERNGQGVVRIKKST